MFNEEPGTELVTKFNDTNLTLTFVKKANRFATVKVTGMTVNIKINHPNYQMDLTEKMDIQYNLKKDTASGEWKIYNYLPFYDEEAVITAYKGEI